MTVSCGRKKTRLEGFDYNLPGEYFITICTKNWVNYLGEICDESVRLSVIGKVVNKCWKEIQLHFNNVGLDEYVIMPNHLHGIVLIKDSICSVGNWHANSLRNQERRFQRLPVIIGSFKSATVKLSNRIQNDIVFSWQKSFYDHIIESQDALDNIREYIRLNPCNWEGDLENDNVFNQTFPK
ncbi:transposase [Patescibacteria group bacterium]